MPYFPQLLTGSLAQYPVRIAWRSRAVVNEALDGSRFTSADPDGGQIDWDLNYSGLAPAELELLRDLFAACEGRLGSFVFADPAGNLLARSEDFAEAPWQSDPLLAFTAGAADPFGGLRAAAVQNNGGVAQAVRQTVDVPGSFETAFSVWIRATGGAAVTLRCSRGAASNSAVFAASPVWHRVELQSALSAAGAGVDFGIELPVGASVELFGAQMEAQRGASGYKPTLAQSGIYPEAHFAQDEFEFAADGYQSFAARLRIVCAPGG